jgi:hypothetical protein
MDYSKVEPALAVELERSPSDRSLSVFIQTKSPLLGEQVAELRSFGVASVQGDRIVTAFVSPDAVAKLSDLPWVEQISLAKKRRPL